MPVTTQQGFLRFTVTNHGTARDYVTIPRGSIVWTDTRETSLGYQSPEFGRAIEPGASGEMWIGFQTQPGRSGDRTLEVGFQSSLTNAIMTVDVPTHIASGPAATTTASVTVTGRGGQRLVDATVDDVPLDGSNPSTRAAPGGSTSLPLTLGLHALTASAAGYESRTQVVNATPSTTLAESFVLDPASVRVSSTETRNVTIDDSIWSAGFSKDLTTVATAPMNHNDHGSRGHLVGVNATGKSWELAFDPLSFAASQVSGFQANDATATVSDDGALAAALDWNGVVHVVDTSTGTELWRADRAGDVDPWYPPGSPYANGFLTVGATAFSPDDAWLAAGGANGHLVVFGARNGSVLWKADYPNEIRALRYSPDGRTLYVGAGDWAFHALDAATGTERWKGESEFWPFFFVAENANGTLVGEGGKDGVARVYDAASGALSFRQDLSPGFVTGMGIGPDRVIVSHWPSGVHAYAMDGDLLWARAIPTAVVATTDDARYALVGSRDFQNVGGLQLLDANGTSLWSLATSGAPCTTNVSPFPAAQFDSVRVREVTPTELRIAAACIGGGVVMGTIDLETITIAPPTPVTSTTTPAPPSATTPDGTSPPTPTYAPSTLPTTTSTPAATPTKPTPAPALALGLAVLAVATLVRRRR